MTMAMTLTLARQSRETRASVHGNPRWHALSSAAGLALHAYRPDHVLGRIERAIEREGADGVDELTTILRRDARARARFRRAVAISVTGHFRDPHQFDLLRETIAPSLVSGDRRLRVWSAGCATGHEVYSVAAVLQQIGALDRAQLLGSDVLAENIEQARAGAGNDFPVSSAVTTRVRFETRDLLLDGAPDGAFGLILCRNVGIYLAPPARGALMAMLAATLSPDGILLLGRSERLIDPSGYGLEPFAPHAYRRPA
ncbi:MAG: chemotaxis protein methyltransferase CheR [Thermoleophilaceae bacterium]|nr:chemotaxis protein methyltransferase CheR [Thermoleophilaceae bacterium]